MNFEYDVRGQMTSMSFSDGTTFQYGYDALGRTDWTSDEFGVTDFIYDDATGGLARVDYPGGRFVEYEFDEFGRRTRMIDDTGFAVHYFYDEHGQLQTRSLMDYCMPRADDLPDFIVDTTVTPCTHNPLGVKGCGEAGAIGSPAAIMNAVTDAVGNKEISMPATPEKVWRAIRGE